MRRQNAILESLENRLLLSVSAQEQYFVYLLNRVRANPAAYQTEAEPDIPINLVDLSTIATRPPLAVNDQLFASAQIKSDDISADAYNFVDTHHYSPTLAQWPNKTVRDAGYALPAGWTNDDNYVESLGAGPETAAKLLREFISEENNPAGDDGHRVHLLGLDGHVLNNEIGVGHTFDFQSLYGDYWAVHATYRDSSFRFLTGVVYNDANHNGRYDLNEGLSGVSVSAGGAYQATTNAAGGWSIQVPDGQYTVFATGGTFNGLSTLENVSVSGGNVEVDFASGLPGGWVNFQRVGAQPPSIVVASRTLPEGNGGTQPMTFTISLAAASPEAWTVNYATANGTATAGADYTARSEVLTFLPGETSKDVDISILGDIAFEDNETFTLNVTGPANSMQVTGTIVNDDAHVILVSVSDAAVIEGAAGQTQLTFTVTLSEPADETMSVHYSTSNGTATAGVDYLAVADGVVEFLPDETSKTVTVTVLGDLKYEANETVLLTLSDPVGVTIARGQGVGTITNDDPQPLVSAGDAVVAEGSAGAALLTFTVTLSESSADTITVTYATADGTANAGVDYAAQADVLRFLPGETSKTVSVIVLSDGTFEADETVLLNLSGAVGATIVRGQGVGTIANDDVAVVPAILMRVGTKKRLPVANAQRKAVSFGAVAVGVKPPVQKFWVYNTGNATLSLGRMRLPKGFALASTQPRTVAPGKVATFLVKMNTNAARKYSGQLTFGTNDPGNPTYRIPLAGSVGGRSRAKAAARLTAAAPIEQRRADYAGLFSSSVIRDPAAAEVL